MTAPIDLAEVREIVRERRHRERTGSDDDIQRYHRALRSRRVTQLLTEMADEIERLRQAQRSAAEVPAEDRGG